MCKDFFPISFYRTSVIQIAKTDVWFAVAWCHPCCRLNFNVKTFSFPYEDFFNADFFLCHLWSLPFFNGFPFFSKIFMTFRVRREKKRKSEFWCLKWFLCPSVCQFCCCLPHCLFSRNQWLSFVDVDFDGSSMFVIIFLLAAIPHDIY